MMKYEIKMSRLALLFYLALGLVAGLAGWGFIWLFGGDWNGEAANTFTIGLFYFFMGVCPVIIVLQMIWYLIFPPTLITANEKEITFAIGFRYKQYAIPLRLAKEARLKMVDAQSITLSGPNMHVGGLAIEFEKSEEIPGGLITSIGVVYFMYTLKSGIFFMNKNVNESVKTINSLIEKHGSKRA